MRLLGPLLLLTPLPLTAADDLVFAPPDIIEWEHHSFAGDTDYALVEVDGRKAVYARCTDGTASGLFFRGEIDLAETPILEWEWRVDQVFDDIDETTRAGDDHVGRIYVVDERRFLRWRTRAVNYVWASAKPEGSSWENPHSSQARMIAVQSGPPERPGRWFTERRNVREDFRRHHGRDPERISALAIMTDCDDTGQSVEAWYGTIRFLPANEESSR